MSKTNQFDFVTALRDEQACCSTHVFNVALNQQARLLQLHLTTLHISYNWPAGMSVTIKLIHVCKSCILPAAMFESVATELQACL